MAISRNNRMLNVPLDDTTRGKLGIVDMRALVKEGRFLIFNLSIHFLVRIEK